jgi:hypothetical protein
VVDTLLAQCSAHRRPGVRRTAPLYAMTVVVTLLGSALVMKIRSVP